MCYYLFYTSVLNSKVHNNNNYFINNYFIIHFSRRTQAVEQELVIKQHRNNHQAL